MNEIRVHEKMLKAAPAYVVVLLLSCSSINFTFPLHRDAAKYVLLNNTEKCDKTPDRMTNIVDRTKNMASNIENALKKMLVIDTAQDNVNIKKGTGRCSHAKQGLVGNDLSNYEQLVIMKKYPYLDLKEAENYHPMPHKNAGQRFHSGSMSDHESNFCESSNREEINVDITNRGLSGFAIPSRLLKKGVRSMSPIQPTSHTEHEKQEKSADSEEIHDLIKELEQDITKFILK